MYNTLWYAGRRCWGSEGVLRQGAKQTLTPEQMEEYDIEEGEEANYWDCEDNPKYKIDMCDPQTDEISDLIYDAWGMHVSNDGNDFTFADFVKLIKEGRELNDYDRKMLKINKTFDEWVEVLMDPRYPYQYESRKAVASQLMCTIGSGYGLNKDGFIIQEASGADQDQAIYGDWENAKFREDIKKVVYELLDIPEVEATIDTDCKITQEYKEKKKQEERKQNESFYKTLKSNGLYDESEGDLHWKEIHRRLDIVWAKYEKETGKSLLRKDDYHAYYPISSSSPIYAVLDAETRERLGIKQIHESYVKEAIRICQEILEHADIEDKAHHKDNNTKFAKKLLLSQGFTEYASEVPQEIDKYALEKTVLELTQPITSTMKYINGKKNNYTTKPGEYYYYFNNTKDNNYADNSYNFFFNIDNTDVEKGYFNSIEPLKNFSWYEQLKNNLEEISKLDGVGAVEVYFDNSPINNDRNGLNIKVSRHKYHKSVSIFENDLIKQGFQIGQTMCSFQIGENWFIMQKPKPLGEGHPDFKTKKECFSVNKQFEVYDADYNKIATFNIDERGFNSISLVQSKTIDFSKWILSQHKLMKDSDENYGSGKKEGKEKLYAHDFFIWLKHQNNI
jgi:hypothetical protein